MVISVPTLLRKKRKRLRSNESSSFYYALFKIVFVLAISSSEKIKTFFHFHYKISLLPKAFHFLKFH